MLKKIYCWLFGHKYRNKTIAMTEDKLCGVYGKICVQCDYMKEVKTFINKHFLEREDAREWAGKLLKKYEDERNHKNQ